MHGRYRFLGLFALALGSLAAAAGPARADFHTSYSITLDAGYSDVTNILLLEHVPDGGSTTWAFTAWGDPNRPSTTTITNPFGTSEPTVDSLLIGLTQDLPNDAPGQKHVVLFMNDTAASLAKDIAWGTLFRSTLEEDLIAAIELGTSGQDFPIVLPGIDAINAFASGDAVDGILDPQGVSHSAWFQTGGSFTVMSWSGGTQIGTGTSANLFSAPVPEPSSFVLAGVAAAAFAGVRALKRKGV